MRTDPDPLPADLAAAHAVILAERNGRLEAEGRARNAEALMAGARLEIERLKLLLAKARRAQFGQTSERSARIVDQLELQLAELEESAAEDATASLLAMILFEKYGAHQPLNRQSERYAREGVELDLSTMADQVGAGAAVLAPLHELIRRHVLAAERLHGDDTTVPVLAKGKTNTGRLWVYVRDDRPFGQGQTGPPAALFHYSPDRRGAHPERHLAGYAGILQADAYAGFGGLYAPTRAGGAVTEALCWAHARRRFYELAELARTSRAPPAPLAVEAVRQIDAIFACERAINGHPSELRRAYRGEHVAALATALASWMRAERPKLSRHAEVAKAFDYLLKRWPAFSRFLDDGRICLTNNAAERALRAVALGRKAWLFAGSDRGGERAAVIYTLIGTAKLNGVDPQAWLADVLERIAAQPSQRLHDLLPWHWIPPAPTAASS